MSARKSEEENNKELLNFILTRMMVKDKINRPSMKLSDLEFTRAAIIAFKYLFKDKLKFCSKCCALCIKESRNSKYFHNSLNMNRFPVRRILNQEGYENTMKKYLNQSRFKNILNFDSRGNRIGFKQIIMNTGPCIFNIHKTDKT